MKRPRGELSFDCGSTAAARAVRDAIAPELTAGPDGAVATASADGTTLHVVIEAEDLSWLRAAVTSVTRLIDAALAVWRAGETAGAGQQR